FCDFSETEEAAIDNYVSNGGGLLIFSLGALRETSYLPELNQVLSDEWGIKFTNNIVTGPELSFEALCWNISGKLSYEGVELEVSNDKASVLADYGGKACIAAHLTEKGGRVLVIGSDLMFTNPEQRKIDVNNQNGSLLLTQWTCKLIPNFNLISNTSETPNNEFSAHILFISFITLIGTCIWIRRKRSKD
ncbi:MAG: hypothetical protein ACFFDT_13330, partial [Candidatus Hodarchaeota archaeon]